jgi:hypothetical protein
MASLPTQDAWKICAVCGRRFDWRRKWAHCWDQVRYCSARCRGRRLRRLDDALERSIIELLAARGGTICPSEAARRVSPDDWRPLMEAARSAGRRLAARGALEIRQRGRSVDPSLARGRLRFARGPAFGSKRGSHAR